jgi:hypothetical protein
MSKKRMYTLFAQLVRPEDFPRESALLQDVPKGEALRAYRNKRDYMHKCGFSVTEWIDEGDNLPAFRVRNPITGLDECHYWIRETA